MKQITFYFVLKFETDLELGASQIPCMQLQHCDCNCEERNLLASRAARARAPLPCPLRQTKCNIVRVLRDKTCLSSSFL